MRPEKIYLYREIVNPSVPLGVMNTYTSKSGRECVFHQNMKVFNTPDGDEWTLKEPKVVVPVQKIVVPGTTIVKPK